MNPPDPFGLPGDAIPVAPGLGSTLDPTRVPRITPVIDARVAWISAGAMGLGLVAGFLAEALVRLIGLVTNLAFYHRVSTDFVAPAGHHLGWTMLLVPVAGGALGSLVGQHLAVAFEWNSLREAADHMVREGVGRLPVDTRDQRLAGIITRSDLLEAHAFRLEVAVD